MFGAQNENKNIYKYVEENKGKFNLENISNL